MQGLMCNQHTNVTLKTKNYKLSQLHEDQRPFRNTSTFPFKLYYIELFSNAFVSYFST